MIYAIKLEPEFNELVEAAIAFQTALAKFGENSEVQLSDNLSDAVETLTDQIESTLQGIHDELS